MQMDKDEQVEIIKRKNSVIIHGLHEPEGDCGEERKRNDEDRIIDKLHQIRCDEISISNCARLGKQQTDSNAKSRPIKLVLVSEGQKDKLLYNAKNLWGRDGLEVVFIHQHQTPSTLSVPEEVAVRYGYGKLGSASLYGGFALSGGPGVWGRSPLNLEHISQEMCVLCIPYIYYLFGVLFKIVIIDARVRPIGIVYS